MNDYLAQAIGVTVVLGLGLSIWLLSRWSPAIARFIKSVAAMRYSGVWLTLIAFKLIDVIAALVNRRLISLLADLTWVAILAIGWLVYERFRRRTAKQPVRR
jgi:hypothetical protein